ncbi:TPA: N-terminal phage integrase SAM-like domain-containing protein, partial [Streptococcus pyogenes]
MKIKEHKKKNGTIVYRASIYLGIDQMTGKRVKTSITGRTRKEVNQKAKHAQLDFLSNGSTIHKEAQIRNYQELAELWLKSYQLTVKPQTYESTKLLLKNHILPVFGNMKLERITPSFVQQFANKLAHTLVNFKVACSINRRILQYAVLLQLIPYNPAREIIIPKKQKKSADRVKFINP